MTPDNFPILNQTQTDIINLINTVWGPIIQIYGIRILLALAVLEIGILGLAAIHNRDFSGIVSDLTRALLGIGVVYLVFTNAQAWGQAVIDTFLQIGKATSGMSPDVLTPSGIMETGFGLAQIFWKASGRAGWLISPSSAAATLFCTIVVVLAYAAAAIIYLLALIEAAALVVGGSVLLAFASLRWTHGLLPKWAAAVMGVGARLMFLLMILTVGLNLAQGWSVAMAGEAASISGNTFLASAAIVEALVFVALVHAIPRQMAGMVGGASALTFGEAFLASGMAALGRGAASVGSAAAQTTGQMASAAASAGASAASKAVQKMLLS